MHHNMRNSSLTELVAQHFPDKTERILITGGHGFIGSHTAKFFLEQGYRVRIVDRKPRPPLLNQPEFHYEYFSGTLCDIGFCRNAVANVGTILHFAAVMGGMGAIHEANDFPIYTENHLMTLSLLRAATDAGVKHFLFASSACVYDRRLQDDGTQDCQLRESDVWASPPPLPQGLYGLEKLNTELVLHQYEDKMDIKIARFHNVFGPHGAWNSGFEKAPCALIRKAAAIYLLHDLAIVNDTTSLSMELWGDGTQRRSFLFIDDCVEGVVRLLISDCKAAVNVGSDQALSIKELAEIALRVVGLDPARIQVKTLGAKPVGVTARNSNNDCAAEFLKWRPVVTLQEGMRRTASWVLSEMRAIAQGASKAEHEDILRRFLSSKEIRLDEEAITFGILLPVTSRPDGDACLRNLQQFAKSLSRTTRWDRSVLSITGFRLKIYVAIDDDDFFLLRDDGEKCNRVESILRTEGLADVETLIIQPSTPRGNVCALWRDCARQAWKDGCEYFVLFGDDVELQDEGWMSAFHSEFFRLQQKNGTALGCLAFTDTTFPGMPTFPIVHRDHMEVFNGEVVPDTFVNQDGDPYLFQLYRRWGCSNMLPFRISNKIGGEGVARYTKSPAVGWTFDPLDEGDERVTKWLQRRGLCVQRLLTLDIIVPCYRVQLSILDKILALKPSESCSVMFVVIVDDPKSPHIQSLLTKYGDRPDMRIRVNDCNQGASASRNRGINESAAEWMHFLDDDVEPAADLLVQIEKAIRSQPDAAGFVCTVLFPPATTVFTTAVHLAGVTYFWDIARKWAQGHSVPWGVTASLTARRNVKDGILYDLRFPKTGGGEDIDFCLKKHHYFVLKGGKGFYAAPEAVATHPWWNNGARSYWRFYMWSKGDGALIKLYPRLTYIDCGPCSGEWLLIVLLSALLVAPLAVLTGNWRLLSFPFKLASAVVVSNLLHDLYRHLYRNSDRTASINSTVTGFCWLAAVVESSFVRLFSELGRTVGQLERKEFKHLGRRFDWFAGRWGPGPRAEERKNSAQRMGLCFLILSIFLGFW